MLPADVDESGAAKNAPSQPLRTRILRYLYVQNPFYLLSVCFVFHGSALWFQSGTTAHNPWPLIGLITGYVLALAVTAFVIVRFGNVWDDARSIFLIVLILFVEMSLCFDDVLMLFPSIGKPLLIAGLLFAVCVSEGLMFGLRIRMPALFRVPLHVMLALLFLYPLFLVPGRFLASPDTAVISWRIFLFSPIVAVAMLTLLPAVRRGPDYVRHNGTPWNWPWFPWTAIGTVIIGLGVRAYAISLSFDPVTSLGLEEAMQFPTAFGGYFLVPVILAGGLLLLETGKVTNNRRLERLALLVPFFCVWLAIPARSPGLPYAEFLHLLTQHLGSPVWLTSLAAVGFGGYALLRRIHGGEHAFVAALLLLSVTNSETVGLDTLVSLQPIPLLIIALFELGWGGWKADSRPVLLAVVCAIAALRATLAPAWPDDVRNIVACHLIGVATIVVGIVFNDAFARLLRKAGGLLLVGVGVLALTAPEIALPSARAWNVPSYMAALVTVSFVCAFWRSSWSYYFSGIAVLLLSLCGLAWQTYWTLKQLADWKGLDSFAVAGACLAVAAIISAVKGGIAQKMVALVPRPRPPTN